MRIRVQLLNVGILELDVEVTETIEDIKKKIRIRQGIPSNELRFRYELDELSDAETISDLGLNDGSLLLAEFKDTRNRIIWVETTTGRKFAMVARLSDSVGTLKAKIRRRYGIRETEQRLTYGGASNMKDDQTLSTYVLHDDPHIQLILEVLFHISVVDDRGSMPKTIRFIVCGSDLVGSVSRKLEASLGVAAGDWLLIKCDDHVPLNRERTLSDYNISDGHTLYVIGNWPPMTSKSEQTQPSFKAE